jgi:pyruvate/2-oxoglutarate dehydrogenase complex dihydrolipoamide dehydrogenase (E3) component
MDWPKEWNLLVIGGGAAGMGAARAGRRRGARVLLVQDGPIGGDCAFTGCVPSKVLIAAAGRGGSVRRCHGYRPPRPADVAATEGDQVFRREGMSSTGALGSMAPARWMSMGAGSGPGAS